MSAEPYADAASLLRDELRRAWLRVEYQIRAGWSREQPHLATDTVTPMDIGKLFATARGEHTAEDTGAATVLEQWLAVHRTVEARIAATIASGGRLPMLELLRAFQLTQRQWSALMFALLPDIDPNLVQAYRYLAHDATCRGLDARLLSMLVYDTPASRSLMARDLSPSSPLVRYRLLDMSSAATPGESLMFRKLRAAPRLAYLIDGSPLALDPELGEFAELRGAPAGGHFPAVTVERAIAALGSREIVLAVQGQRGLGKKLLLQVAATHWKRRVLVIDGKRLAGQPPSQQQAIVRALVRELLLLDAIPVVADVDDVVAQEAERDGLPACVDLMLDEWDGQFAITFNRERMPRIHQRPIVHLVLEVPGLDVRATMWREIVPSLSNTDADGLAGRFAIPGGVIVAAAQAATAGRLPDAGPSVATDLDRAVAAQLHQRITRLGKKLPQPFDLDDLIVDDDTRGALLEITAAAGQRRRIRDQFKLRGAQGISVLFSGHPGVGKTMSATVLARRLGLDIYEIDLSQVVSKWLGETEKNLSDVFDAAEPGHVVLLFNEADSLFGKRTSDVKSSNDRYANLETNYLLQRLERSAASRS